MLMPIQVATTMNTFYCENRDFTATDSTRCQLFIWQTRCIGDIVRHKDIISIYRMIKRANQFLHNTTIVMLLRKNLILLYGTAAEKLIHLLFCKHNSNL